MVNGPVIPQDLLWTIPHSKSNNNRGGGYSEAPAYYYSARKPSAAFTTAQNRITNIEISDLIVVVQKRHRTITRQSSTYQRLS